ncbi:MAG: nuclease A inhibitor family protein [Aridibacter sp.]
MNEKKKKNSRKKENDFKRKSKSVCKKVKDKKKGNEKTELNDKFTKEEKIDKPDFIQELKKTTDGLIYISETDSEIFPFIGGKSETVNIESLLKQINAASDIKVKEITFEDFFENLITIQDWFEEEEKETAEKFLKLKKLLEENLKDLKVFKIGKIEIEIYVVGLDEENNMLGIKTEAVET